MTARTHLLQASALDVSLTIHSFHHRTTIIFVIYNARTSRCSSCPCCFYCCARFCCASPVCRCLLGCYDPANLPRLNSYLKARSEDSGAAVKARSSDNHDDGCMQSTSDGSESNIYTGAARRDIPQKLATRDAVDDFITAVANVNTREPGNEQATQARSPSDGVTPDSLVSRDATGEFLAALMNSRDVTPEKLA